MEDQFAADNALGVYPCTAPEPDAAHIQAMITEATNAGV